MTSVGGRSSASVGQITDGGVARGVRVQRRKEQQEKRKRCRQGQSAADGHSPLVVELEQQAGRGAPHHVYQVLGSNDDAYHGRRKPQLSEVQGEEGQQAGPGAAQQEVEEAGQRQGAVHVDLPGSSHGGGRWSASLTELIRRSAGLKDRHVNQRGQHGGTAEGRDPSQQIFTEVYF